MERNPKYLMFYCVRALDQSLKIFWECDIESMCIQGSVFLIMNFVMQPI
jgi:hypothetical protein